MNPKLYVIGSTAFMVLAGIVLASIPPPPVDQTMGVYDTLFYNLTESKCRDCHSSGVPERHHLLVKNGTYGCTNCHPVITNPDGSQTIILIRDCMRCHGTIFNNISIRRPHHETKDAQDKHCSSCHGNLVDDFDDGHYIPTYNVSLVTPDTKYKVINTTTGKKWGGCEACHERDTTLEPPIYYSNKTHHNLGSLSGFNPPNNSKCRTCHDSHSSQYGSDFIRYCERCHAIKSLHNIQYNYSLTSGQKGYGHIGTDWDCNGCHAWYVAGAAPETDIIVPTIAMLNLSKVLEGETTVVAIGGSDFITTVNNVTHSSDIVLTNGTNLMTLTPSSITPSQIVVTIPPLSRGGYGIYALKNGSIKSNKVPLVTAPKVIIDSAVKNDTKVTISGSGFGQYDPDYKDWVNVTIELIKRGTVTPRTIQITSWSDTLIEVNSPDALTGDTATVHSVYGTNSTKATGKR